jgi:hypothetical protein
MPSFAILSPRNKKKVPRQLLIMPKNSTPATSSANHPGNETTSVVVTPTPTNSQAASPANTSQPTSTGAVRSKKMTKMREKKAISSHPTPPPPRIKKTFSNDVGIPRMHRDMRVLCDEFNISDQSRLALRKYDATRLEDFCYMTDEDYATMMEMQEKSGSPIPPLQQRKIRVLLTWTRSLMNCSSSVCIDNKNKIDNRALTAANAKTWGNKDTSTTLATTAGIPPSSSLTTIPPPPTPTPGVVIPSDWEKRFHADLPSLKEELKRLGGEQPSQIPNWLSSLRILCGFSSS